ncbi:MAG: sugar transferase [bacterium]
MAKRIFDLVFSSIGLLILLPVFLILAVLIKFDSRGPVFFRQERVGRFGQVFRIHKFRTMTVQTGQGGPLITTSGDSRITRVGRILRTYKLDELPQLIDVVMGNMSLVGPRPEVPRYVRYYPEEIREAVLSVPPGITDFAAIEFKDENDMLNLSEDPEQEYIKKILPVKLAYYQKYIRERSLWLDFVLILRTIESIVS